MVLSVFKKVEKNVMFINNSSLIYKWCVRLSAEKKLVFTANEYCGFFSSGPVIHPSTLMIHSARIRKKLLYN
jgi:hypothetical protein